MAASGKFGDDRVNGGGPDEGLGILVPSSQEIFNGGDKTIDTENLFQRTNRRRERVAPDAFVGQFGRLLLVWFTGCDPGVRCKD